jgi:hypothetical protein
MDPGATENGLTFVGKTDIIAGRELVKLPQPFGSSGVHYHR